MTSERDKVPPPPIAWHLLANAPGPDPADHPVKEETPAPTGEPTRAFSRRGVLPGSAKTRGRAA